MRTYIPHIIALILYSFLACLVTWPLPLHLHTHLAAMEYGELGQDVWQHAWNMWWVHQALLVEHTNPYQTTALFYPHGASLYMHSLNLPLGLLGLPLLPLLGIVATYNILTLLTMVLVGYCSFLLARHIISNDSFSPQGTQGDTGGMRHTVPAALVAGTVVLCAAQRILELRGAQLATLSDYGVPLTLLCVLVALKRRTIAMAALVALAMLLTALSKWYHLLHALLVIVPIMLWHAVFMWRQHGRRGLLDDAITWARIGGISAILFTPFFIPTFLETITSPYSRKSNELVFSANVLHLIPKTCAGIWHAMPLDWWDACIFAWAPVLLALLGVILAPRRVALWVIIGGICLVLSLGPTLHVGDTDTGIPMPYALLRALPVVDALRAPVRINAVTHMMLGIVAAIGLTQLFQHVRSVAASWAIAVVAIASITAEAAILPFPLIDASVSPFYTQIADEPGEWSLLELPFDRFDRDRLEMFTQTYHGKYILTGLISRKVPRVHYELALPIAQVDDGEVYADIVRFSSTTQEQLLRALRTRYVIVREYPGHPGLDERQIATAHELLGPLTEVYADDELRAYRLDAVAAWLDGPGRTTRAEVPLFPALQKNWYPVEATPYGPVRWLPQEGAGVAVYVEHAQRVVLDITLSSLLPDAAPLEIWVNDSRVQTFQVQGPQIRHYITSPLYLSAGSNVITLRAIEEGISPRELGISNDTRSLSFGIHQIELHKVQ